MREWSSIYESHSGERGIFNREASQKQAAKNGRRDASYAFGTNPCSEIILRPYQFCNLSSCIIRSTDTIDDISRKIRLATILGTFQASLTDFPYLRKIWQKNTEEEALLGVSMTGICDNTLLNNPDDESLPARLEKLRDLAVATNAEFANAIGINQSVAVTAVKPEGTVSQLCSTASGIHPQHSKYYIRRVRADNKDPLTQFMIQAGFVAEPCVMKPDSTTVFSFPVAVADGALLREDLTAIQHLRLWLIYQRHYTEHKPSVTISVLENEWLDVGAWTFKNFGEVTGVSFLPMDLGSYRQAPYEEIDEDTYNRLKAVVPESVDWNNFVEYDDNVEGVQTLSCTAGGCEI
jgi:ribonucleoside-diphosphate reductase alpha chain